MFRPLILARQLLVALTFLTMLAAGHAQARTWVDASGRFRVDAELLAINENVVVLRAKDGRLIAVEIPQLSKDDQAFLQTEAAGIKQLGARDQDHVWHLAGDVNFKGRIVDYFAHNMTIERKNSKLYVDGTKESDLPKQLLKFLPLIVENFESAKIKDLASLKTWLTDQGKVPHVYPLEGVTIALTDGEEVRVPIFLFNSSERGLLEPGLARWKALQTEKLADEDRSRYAREQALMLSSTARAYQQDAALQAQARRLQLELLAVDAGVTDLWEVLLIPPNPYAYPFTVVVPARDSGSAQIMVQEKYPAYTVDATRKLN